MPKSIRFSIVLTLAVLLLTQCAFMPMSLVLLLGTMLWGFYHFLKQDKTVHKAVIFIALFFALALIYIQYGTFLGVNAGVAILISFLFAKALESRTSRDLVVLFNFALFVSASSFLYSQTIWVTIGVIVCLLSCFIGLYRLQKINFEHIEPARPIRQDLKHVLSFFAYALPFFVLLFLFFPRLPPLWHIPISSEQATTGLSDQMAPGDIASLSQSSRLAFRIIADVQQLPPRHELYWRAMVLDQYTGQRWQAAAENKQLIPFQANAQLQGLDYQYLAADANVEWIMGLEKSVPVSRGLSLQPDWGIRSHQQQRGKNKPIQLRWVKTGDWQRSAQLEQQELQRSLQYATNFDPQAQQLAQQLYLQSGQDPQRYIQNVLAWYKQQGFQYSLSPGKLADHHLDDFLFKHQVGFCEHYASSFAMLMRYVGIPARVVVGYQGGQAALDGQSWEVRQLDAHAWNEVWLNQQWQRIDPTAMIAPERIDLGMQDLLGQDQSIWGQQSILQNQQFTWLKQLRIWSDYATFQWQSKVVGYDQAQQIQWLSRFGLSSPLRLALFLIATICIFIAVYALWIHSRQSQWGRGYTRHLHQFNRQLQPDQQKQPSETHATWLLRLSQQLQGEQQLFLQQLAEYDRHYRYGKQLLSSDRNIKLKLKKCSNKLKSKTKSLS